MTCLTFPRKESLERQLELLRQTKHPGNSHSMWTVCTQNWRTPGNNPHGGTSPCALGGAERRALEEGREGCRARSPASGSASFLPTSSGQRWPRGRGTKWVFESDVIWFSDTRLLLQKLSGCCSGSSAEENYNF